VTELARYFLARHGHMRELSMSDGALDALRLHRWPGNVRELEHVIERAVALAESDRIELDDLPPNVRGEYAEVLAPALARAETMRAWGSRYARLVFERCGRNKRQACRLLDISYHTLQAYLRFASRDARGSAKQVPAWARLPDDDAPGCIGSVGELRQSLGIGPRGPRAVGDDDERRHLVMDVAAESDHARFLEMDRSRLVFREQPQLELLGGGEGIDMVLGWIEVGKGHVRADRNDGQERMELQVLLRHHDAADRTRWTRSVPGGIQRDHGIVDRPPRRVGNTHGQGRG
jgi:hypothetical protein